MRANEEPQEEQTGVSGYWYGFVVIVRALAFGVGVGIGFCLVFAPVVFLLRDVWIENATSRLHKEISIDRSMFEFIEPNFTSAKDRNYLVTKIKNTSDQTYWNLTIRCEATESDGYRVGEGNFVLGRLGAGETKKIWIPIGYEKRVFTDNWKNFLYVVDGERESRP